MLKKRSRPVSSTKQGLMADPFPLSSPNGSKPRSSPLFYPRLFVGFSSKGFSEANEVAMSPTSILETKPFSPTANPFFSDKNPKKPLVESSIQDSKHQPVGLGIVDELKKSSSPDSRMVLFGSQLKIQIPSIAPTGTADCPQSPIEFGIKNRNSQLALLSPARRSPMGSSNLVSGSLSATEMEMSEDYTCVIAHGPNPKTTHIFDNCIIESCCGGQGFVAACSPRKEKGFPDDRDRVSGYRSDDFLDFCHACKRSLGLGKDIFMYRGDKAFCSRECRYQEMLFDGGMEDCTPDPSTIL